MKLTSDCPICGEDIDLEMVTGPADVRGTMTAVIRTGPLKSHIAGHLAERPTDEGGE